MESVIVSVIASQFDLGELLESVVPHGMNVVGMVHSWIRTLPAPDLRIGHRNPLIIILSSGKACVGMLY